MVALAESPAGRLVAADAANRAHLSRQAKSGRAIRIAPGLYIVGSALPPEKAVRQHLCEIISIYWPCSVISARSAMNGGQPEDGWLFLAHPDPPRSSALLLPELNIMCSVGPGPLPGDTPMPFGVYLAGPARLLIENVSTPGRPSLNRPSRAAGLERTGDQIDEMARRRGYGYIRTLLAEVEQLAPHFELSAVNAVKKDLIAVLGTLSESGAKSKRLGARVAGSPYDAHRVEQFERLVYTLQNDAPRVRPMLGDQARFEWMPFFEAYFSNYIEGTVFGLDEAKDLVVNGVVPFARPADAHDVTATYRIVSDVAEMSTVAKSFDEFVEVLCGRHATLMASRSDKNPGRFKELANSAGGYRFVEPDLLQGTLREGFRYLQGLMDPFKRAVYVMFLVAECHPFDDGNGRIARIMANAELVKAGQARVIIPTAFRDNYLSSLSALSNLADGGEALISVLDFSRQWVLSIDWSTWESSLEHLELTNALLEPAIAESSGQRLRLSSQV